MNGLSNLNENYRNIHIAPIDHLIRFWKSKVKVAVGYQLGKASTSMLGRRSKCSCLTWAFVKLFRLRSSPPKANVQEELHMFPQSSWPSCRPLTPDTVGYLPNLILSLSTSWWNWKRKRAPDSSHRLSNTNTIKL